jgi:uncharacterized protein with GYD domain
MAAFFMFGKYSSNAVKDMSIERTEKTKSIIKELSGELKSMYALLGEYDLVFIVEFPGVEQVMKASLVLTIMTGISFQTAPAIEVEEFDKMIPAV